MPTKFVNINDVSNIIRNQNNILEKLNELKLISSSDVPQSIFPDYSMLYINVRNVYDSIDKKFDLINSGDWQSAYYKPATKRLYEPSRTEWQRWIDTLNDLWEIVNGRKGKWQYLLCRDGYATINGKKILVQGEMINGA